jgi:hypothetical protein
LPPAGTKAGHNLEAITPPISTQFAAAFIARTTGEMRFTAVFTSRGDWTPIELFLEGSASLETHIQRLLVAA